MIVKFVRNGDVVGDYADIITDKTGTYSICAFCYERFDPENNVPPSCCSKDCSNAFLDEVFEKLSGDKVKTGLGTENNTPPIRSSEGSLSDFLDETLDEILEKLPEDKAKAD